MTPQQTTVNSPPRTAYSPPTQTSTQPSSNTQPLHLAQLGDMDDYELADGEPDIRGWEICSVDGRSIGQVNGLLVDTNALKVRYVELELESDLAVDDDHRHAILPIGTARLKEEEDTMIVSLRADVFRTLPPYTRGQLSREYERELMEGLVKALDDTSADPQAMATEFYGSAYFDDQRPFLARRSKTGRASGDASYFRPR